jgi:hypothetical protein
MRHFILQRSKARENFPDWLEDLKGMLDALANKEGFFTD